MSGLMDRLLGRKPPEDQPLPLPAAMPEELALLVQRYVVVAGQGPAMPGSPRLVILQRLMKQIDTCAAKHGVPNPLLEG